MKLKLNKDNTYSIKGMDIEHLEVLFSVLEHVCLDGQHYAERAFEVLNVLEEFGIESPGTATLQIMVD